MSVGKRIKQRRLELNLTVDEVAKALGKNRATIYRYESNEIENLPISILEPLAKVLDTTPAELLDWKTDDINVFSYNNVFPVYKKKVPLLGEIACGKPIYANEDRESYIEIGTDIKADFCLKAKGDSMINARIKSGDIVFIRKQSAVDNGEIAAVLIDDDVTLKRVYYHKDKNIIELRAENPLYQTMIYTDQELDGIRILGKAIAFQSDVIWVVRYYRIVENKRTYQGKRL